MRIGQNPLKTQNITIDKPSNITIGVLNYIPNQVGYFKNQLAVLKLCLHSIRENANCEVDVLVVDNGSCQEVLDYLHHELTVGVINTLILNHKNIGKANAVIQILKSALGDYVFYTDGDIYFKPDWVMAHIKILEAFPNVGVVGGIPLRNQMEYKYSKNAANWFEKNFAGQFETGDLIPEAWSIDFLKSVGIADEKLKTYLDEWAHFSDHRLTADQVTAYIGASHMQYLISREAINSIPHQRFQAALQPDEDHMIDDAIDAANLFRLSTAEPFVYHIGNTISEDWLIEEYQRLFSGAQNVLRIKAAKNRSESHWFWGSGRVRKIVRSLYEWLFTKYY